MSELKFLSKDEILEIQRRNIEEFGGIHGLRDENAFESALMAAQNRAHYEGAGLAVCAATYAFHLVASARFFRWQQTHRRRYFGNFCRIK